jgi:DNA-binding GntR family transcriptional regulator
VDKLPRPRKNKNENAKGASENIPVFSLSAINGMDGSLPKAVQVYTLLRRAIVEMAMPPGSTVNERQICEQLGISRTPLREALLRLQEENLIKIVPNSATYVCRIDLETVFEGQLVREALEMKVIRLAAARMSAEAERKLDVNMYQQKQLAGALDYEGFYAMDEEFHALLCDIGASPRIWRIIHSAKAQLDRVRRLAMPMPSHLDIVLSEHEAVVAGLKLRDPDRAAAAMEVHLGQVSDTIRQLIAERKDLFSVGATGLLDSYAQAARSARQNAR